MLARYKTINALLDDSFAQFAARPAYTCAGHTLSYADLDRYSLQFARYLQCYLGLLPGDRIALQLPNINQYPVVIYGALRAGLVIVNTNPLYTPRELEHQLCDSGAKVLVVLANVAHTAAQIIQQTGVQQVIVTEFADLMPWPKRPLINFAIKYVKKMVPSFQFTQSIGLRDALRLGCQGTLQAPQVEPTTLLCLQYTGGTTGVAKGAMLSHANLCSNAWQVLQHCPYLSEQDHEIFIAPLPLYHIYAFCLHALVSISLGAHNILIPNPRDIPATVAAIKPFKPSVFVGLNTLFKALCRDIDFANLNFSALKTTPSGGMALTPDAAEAWHKITGGHISEGYGLTETSPVVCSNPQKAIQLGTIGCLVAETHAKVVGETGNELTQGEAGELCIKGPQVMQGYWQRPDETAKVLGDDGWLKTGDIAVIQADGYIKLIDRKKDMINVSGFNVYPNELENVISHCPGVLEAAVIGVPDDKTGEAVKLYVVPIDSSLSKESVVHFCREQLTGYKIPKHIEFRDSLPKSNVGKILRRTLRDEHLRA